MGFHGFDQDEFPSSFKWNELQLYINDHIVVAWSAFMNYIKIKHELTSFIYLPKQAILD